MEKIDMNSITKSVQEQIAKIRQSGGNKKTIDTQAEYEQLQQMLSGGNLKKAEMMFVQGLMIEYENSVREANISDNARNSLKNIKKMMPNKTELNEAEAHMVLDLIKNTNGEWNKTEIEYFKQELIQAGYGNLLDEMQNGQGAEETQNNSGENKVETLEKPTEEIVPDEPTPIENKPVEKEIPAEPTHGETCPAEPPIDKKSPESSPKPPVGAKPPEGQPKPPVGEKPPVSAKPPAQDELPEELPPTDEADEPAPLTDEQKAEAQNAGKKVAQYLNGYTMDIEQAHVVEYIKKELNSENIVEFMKGYAKGGADPFFNQLLSEYGFPEKYDVAKDVVQKLRDYIENNEISEKDCKIIDGILAKDEFSKSDIAELDKITQSLTEIPVKQKMNKKGLGILAGSLSSVAVNLGKAVDKGVKNP